MAEITGTTESHLSPIRLQDHEWGAPVVVWGIWASMLLALLAFIGRYAHNGPGWWDELGRGFVPVVVGEQPLTARWLWEPFKEHRLVLTKLILWGLAKLTGDDFRAMMFASALGLGALAFLLIKAAEQSRGFMRYSDAIFPFALLNFGHASGLLQAISNSFPITTVLAGVVLVIITRSRKVLPPRDAVLVGVCLLVLPLLAAPGAVLAPALAFWLAYSGLLCWRSTRGYPRQYGPQSEPISGPLPEGAAHGISLAGDRGGRWNALLIMGLAAGALLAIPIGYLGVERKLELSASPHASTPRAVLRGSLQFLSQMFGTTAQSLSPFSGRWALGLLLFSVGVLVVVWYKRPQEHFRALGLLCFLGSIGLLALALGWGRPGSCYSPHYYDPAVLALCCAYLIGVVYYEATGGRLLQLALLFSTCMFLNGNFQLGLGVGRACRSSERAFEKDILAGMPISLLVDRYGTQINAILYRDPEGRENVAQELAMLKRAKIYPYNFLCNARTFKCKSLNLSTGTISDFVHENGIGHGLKTTPYLSFRLEEPQRVYALRLKCSMDFGGKEPDVNYPGLDLPGPVNFRVSWRRSGQVDFRETGYNSDLYLDTRPGGRTAAVWIDDTIDCLRIYLDYRPFDIKIDDITLFVE